MPKVSFNIVPRCDIEALQDRPCLFGVSVGTPNFSLRKLKEGFQWSEKRFDVCHILLGDSLCRFTLRIQKGLTHSEAEVESSALGYSLIHELSQALGYSPTVIKCSEVLKDRDFSDAYNFIKHQCQINSLFADSVLSDAKEFVTRQIKTQRLAVNEVEAIDLSREYLMEEIAIYHFLALQGWLVDIYCGKELPTLVRLIDGEILCKNSPLSERINISLTVR